MVIDNKELETLERVMQFESKDNEKGLKMYLKTLSLEEVKKIQLVMYIGRGYIDGSISDDNIKDPVSFINEYENSFLFSDDKGIEVGTITDKFSSLNRYIKQGIEILK